MEKIIKTIMRIALRIAYVMLVLGIIIKAMHGVYRLANLGWSKHLFFGFISTIILLIFNMDGVNLSHILPAIIIISLGSKGMLSLFNRLNIYESFTNVPNKNNNEEWVFGFFSSVIIILAIIIGLIFWNGTDPFNNGLTSFSLKSFFGHILLTFGFGLTIVGFACVFVIPNNKEK